MPYGNTSRQQGLSSITSSSSISSEAMQKSVKIHIDGAVQNVFFRYSAQKKAEEIGITGYAKNNPDGSLTIVATGNEDILEKFIVWCKKGPEQAKVDSLEVTDIEAADFTDFNTQ